MGFRDRAENGAFQFLPEDARRYDFIHADGHSGWAGVLYLNPDRDGTPGTSFFRHTKLSWTEMPTAREMHKMARRNRLDTMKTICNDGAHVGRWQEIASVPIRYNRLLLFRRNRFHCAASAFGTTYGNARLVQVFFF